MEAGRNLMAAAVRHRRIFIVTAIGSTLVVIAGLWTLAGQPVSTYSRHHRSAVTLAERTDFLPPALGRCQWAVRVDGMPARGQVYLTRCYLRALAWHDAASMHALSEFGQPFGFRSRIMRRDMAHSADARKGLATATFVPSPVDSAFTTVQITFADGARETLAAVDMSPALGGRAASAGYAWRFQIGTKPTHAN